VSPVLAHGTLLALYGPTSAGKTALAVELALRIEREIGRTVTVVSADSRQIYRYLNIGTSKTRPDEMHGIAHELLDIADPVRKVELEDYLRIARERIEVIFANDGIPFLVGGTGVYIKALVEGWTVETAGAARDELRRDFPPSMRADAYAMLRRLDRAAASKVHPNNYVGVINALSSVVTRTADAGGHPQPDVRAVLLGADPGQRAVDGRVAATYDGQVRRRLLDEVLQLEARYDLTEQLRADGPASRNQVLHTHGYREYFEIAARRGTTVAALRDTDLAEVRKQVVEHIRNYTRRQRSWFPKMPDIRMVSSAKDAFGHLVRTSR